MLIRTGDTVEVRSGNSRGTRARVLSVDSANGKLVVEGVNRVYRHIKRSQKNPQGGRLSKEMPIDASNVLFFCADCGKASRLGVSLADGSKKRVCRKCGSEQGEIGRSRVGCRPILLLHEATNFEVFKKQASKLFFGRIPTALPRLGNAGAESSWIYFLTHFLFPFVFSE